MIYALEAIAQDLNMRYGLQRKIWLSGIGHGAGFGCVQWAIAQNQLP
jgi:hypothetical protein